MLPDVNRNGNDLLQHNTIWLFQPTVQKTEKHQQIVL